MQAHVLGPAVAFPGEQCDASLIGPVGLCETFSDDSARCYHAHLNRVVVAWRTHKGPQKGSGI